ncbi:hypothetical protein TNCV_1546821 [Trichonephila clavipes]|nr:hypothetical protein TNCV_1546821 [Trichonephila clavipes]
MIVQFRNEKVSNHGSIPITIDCNVVAFIVFEEGFHQPIKRTQHGAGGHHPFWHGRRVGRPRQQPDKASGGILPKSHVRWFGESGQQPRLSPGASESDSQRPEFPMAFQGSWGFKSWQNICQLFSFLRVNETSSCDDSLPSWLIGWLSHCRGSQHDLGLTIRPQSGHMRLAPKF